MQINAIHITVIQIRMGESNDTFLRFLFSTKEKTKKKKNRPFEYSTGLHEKNESKRGIC